MTKERTIEQQSSDCKIFGTKENCFGGATENECNHCDYKIQALEQQSEDCVSREKVHYMITGGKYANEDYEQFIDRLVKELENMPPVTPTHGTCKDCKHNYKTSRNTFECSNGHRFYMRIPDTFYCADYEKRGNEE